MKPFYDEGGITIYHGDCVDVFPFVDPGSVGLLLTDPPYGIGYVADFAKRAAKQAEQYDPSWWAKYGAWGKDYPPVVGDSETFDPLPLLAYPRLVLFGANHYADQLPPSPGWVVWDKRRGGSVGANWNGADAELAWCNVSGSVKVFSHLWHGFKRDSELGRHVHPTQKPVALMRWILEKWTEPGDLVFDPYMGSGPVARACLDLGRRYIGVEIVEEYCAAAVGRLGQQVFELEG